VTPTADPAPIVVLVVDDEATTRMLTRAALEPAGFAIVEAEDGAQAIEAFDRARPQLVLLDVDMPRMDGYAVCEALRAHPGARHVPIVMVTGRDDHESIEEAYRAGATDFIAKPVTWTLLPHRVRYALRSSGLLREVAMSEEKFRLITENISDYIAMLDVNGRRLYNSPSYATMFGPRSLAGTNSFAEIHPDDREKVKEVFQETVATGIGRDARFRFVLEDQSVRYFESRSSVIRDEAGKVASVVVVSRDVTELRKQESRIARLARITGVLSGINSAIVRIRDTRELLNEACRIAVEEGQFKLAWIGMLDRQEMRVKPTASAGDGQDYISRLRLGVQEGTHDGGGVVGRAMRGRKAVVTNDIAHDDQMLTRQAAVERGFGARVGLPLMIDGVAEGVFVLYAQEPGFFDDEELKLLEELAGDVSFALESNEKRKKLDYLAYYDALTGAPNRGLFLERLTRLTQAARPSTGKLGVAILDIKAYHTINDNLGRHAGDALLKLVARRLQQQVGVADTVARLGGDQFGLILSGAAGVVQLGGMVERVFASFAEPFVVEGNSVRLSVKGGVTTFPSATDGADADALLTNAEAALKKAKTSPESYLFYAPALNAAIANRLTMEGKMQRALEEGQFELHYQPQVASESRVITGLEALLRWNDPDEGVVLPHRFVPLLEETGMILAVGNWVLKRAMADRRKLVERGLRVPRIAVNVSSMQMRQKDFAGYVAAALDGATGALDIEITESAVMDNVEACIAALREVRAMGVGVALDDFGTGYSSLSYITRLPATTLKLDMSFVADMASGPAKLEIVSAVISLAHAHDMQVVAEGVENEEQAKLLRLLRCDHQQGYLHSRPVPLERIATLLSQERPALRSAKVTN
jgi:diguanylate cyclase (GGDEF)-like protein/PAS domain S-box-containing protein